MQYDRKTYNVTYDVKQPKLLGGCGLLYKYTYMHRETIHSICTNTSLVPRLPDLIGELGDEAIQIHYQI